jgi:two-component system response regulator MtrA
MSARILLVEDDERLGRQIVEWLHRADFSVEWLRDGASALAVDPGGFTLLVLDLMLPGAPGIEVLQRWRALCEQPVLVLSAMSDAEHKVRALDIGADDYLTKPFWPDELVARVRARLRRMVLARADRVEIGPLRIDADARRALLDGADLALTRVEFDLLFALARRPGAAIPRRWLVDHVLGVDAAGERGDERTLDVHVSRIRKKLGIHAPRLATVWGIGYRLRADEAG